MNRILISECQYSIFFFFNLFLRFTSLSPQVLPLKFNYSGMLCRQVCSGGIEIRLFVEVNVSE